jgi:outer membrane receptor protein involved in Fe transport
VSPKGGLVIGPFRATELYVNGGAGFHSNDARGTTITRDPSTGAAVDPVTPQVRATRAEVGVRTVAIPRLQSTVSLWSLSLASELVFSGDSGTTAVGRPSHRYGIECANYYHPRPWLVFDGDLSLSRSRFRDADAAGDRIPGSLQSVVSLGATVESPGGVFGSLRVRYFGPRPLIEDDSVRSRATRLLNAEAGYKIGKGVRVALEVFNVLDAKDSDIDYFYPSRLFGEPAAGIADVHFHPALPRTARVSLIVGR